jgi:hypothetical protein
VTTLDTALPEAAVDTIPVRTDVANDARLPDTGLLLIDNEIVSYTGKASNTFTGVTRGVGVRSIPGASGPVAHDAGAEVRAIDPPFAVSATMTPAPAGQARVRVTLQKTFLAELSATAVAGIESRWIRCRTLRRPLLQDSPLRHLTIDTVRVGTAVAQGILPNALLANDVPLEFSAQEFEVYPFGRRPRVTDTFYMASDDALSKRGLRVTLAFEISLGGTTEGDTGTEPPAELVLSWEYWNGTGWQVITQRQDQTNRLSKSGEVSFPCPQDIASTSVNGRQHYWIRVRIVGGDYGREQFTFDQTNRIVSDTSQIRPPIIQRLIIRYGADPEQRDDSDLKTLEHCLTFNNLTFTDRTREAQQASDLFQPFQPPEQAEQALYLGFDPAPVKGPISLFFDLAAQAYSEGNRPRLVWEYLRQPSGSTPSAWTRLAVVDGTRHLTESGITAFIGPPDFAREGRFGRQLHWLRATNLAPIFQPQPQSAAAAPVPLTAAAPVAAGKTRLQPCPALLASFHPAFAPQPSGAPPAPRVQGLYPNTVLASQTETIQDEILGSSRGVANQTFTLAAFPVIAEQLWVNELATLSEGERAALTARDDVEVDDIKDDQGATIAFWVRWRPVDDLTKAQAADRVYSIDRTFGQVQFGDGIHGMVPPAGRDNLQVTYQAGGGVRGNVAAGLITVLRTTIPFVDHVVNRIAAGGGSDTEPLDRALERGPQMIKHRGRAVTAEDFEWLTRAASQAIARVKVLPTFNDQGRFETGWVTVIIVPESPEARPLPSPQLRAQVEQYLRDRAANLVTFPRHVQVTGPTYVAVDVEAELVPTRIELAPQVEATALQHLRQFLHPLTGGYLNRGWEFGRLPCLSDVYALLEDVGGVDHVGHLAMTLRAVTPTGTTVGEPQRVTEEEPLAVTMPEHTLIYGDTLTITVKA